MARKPRIIVAGQPHHVIVRGVNRQPVFCRDDDYRFYLDSLYRACEDNGCSIHAYVCMTNHVHLLITPETTSSIAKTIQSTGCRYVYYFNKSYQRTGTLWEGRYKSLLIDSETYLFTCQRYIEMNPVRAGMVDDPGHYAWSSYVHNAMGKTSKLVCEHELYRALGAHTSARRSAYRSLFDTPLKECEVNEIRVLTNQEAIMGTVRFKSLISQKLCRSFESRPRGGDRKSQNYRQSRIESNQAKTTRAIKGVSVV